MARKLFRITEVVEICGVDRKFIDRLERERIIEPTIRSKLKYYPRDQVERIRVAHLLMRPPAAINYKKFPLSCWD